MSVDDTSEYPLKRFFMPGEVSKLLNVKPGTLANWRHQKRGPRFVRLLGRLVRYPESDLYDWIERQAIDQ